MSRFAMSKFATVAAREAAIMAALEKAERELAAAKHKEGEVIFRLENAIPLLTAEGAPILIARQNVVEALEVLKPPSPRGSGENG
jgi:hypothetical protein